MAIAYSNVAATTGVINDVPGPVDVTLSFTQTTGTNKGIIIAIDWKAAVGNTFANGTPSITGVTFNGGTAATYIGTQTIGVNSIDFYYGVGQANGATNIVVTWDDVSEVPDSIVVTYAIGAVSATGADQTTPIAQSGSATGLNSPITKTLTTTVSTNLLVDATHSVLSTTISVGADQTQRVNQTSGTLGSVMRQGMSTQATASTADVMSWTEGTTTRDWATYVVELKAAATATGIDHLMMMGVT
jgi:hypothetical protein